MIGRKMICENLKKMLEDEIRNKKILPDTPILSTKQISKKYKVSFITANKAINALVEDGLLYRVHGSGTYISGPVTKNKAIGVCLNTSRKISPKESPTAFAICEGIISAAETRGYHPMLLSENSFTREQLSELNVSGFLFSPLFTSRFMELSEEFEKNKIPYLFMDRLVMDDDINYLEEYSPGEIYKAVNYLLAQNHRRIACIGYNSEELVYRNFFVGYEQAMREKGLFDPALEKTVATNTEDEMKDIVKGLMAQKEPPTVIFLFYVRAFENLYNALRYFKMKIPGDISIMSASSTTLRKDELEITTIGAGNEIFGSTACNLLINLIDGKIHSPVSGKLRLDLRKGNSVKRI